MGGSGCSWIWRLGLILQLVGGIHSWGKEGHYATCKIAEEYLSEDAKATVRELLPSSSQADLASLCSWADEIRFHYHWSGAFHYVNTPDFTCNYEYCRDFHDLHGHRDICVTGAIFNYTKQLEDAFQDSQMIAKFNKTGALLFLSHFLGDVHQPLHVAFTGDEGGNTIFVRWYRRKSNLHRVWDSMIIETALKTFYGNDLLYMIESIHRNLTMNTSFPDCPLWRKEAGPSGAYGWSKEGHVMTCQIAQSLLKPDVAEAVRHLLPAYAKGDLSSLCTWPDQIRHWHKYLWTSSLHFIDTPDNACSFDYSRDCHDQHGLKNMCLAGAFQNFTSQLLHYKEGTADRRYNMTEALLFLSHFMGDIHQPMHVGFSSDKGGNTIELHWFRRKSNLHHVWDRDIILTATADYYEKDTSLLIKDIEANFTEGIWSDDISSWTNCEDLLSCPIKYAAESIGLACKWAYKGVQPGVTLADDYFDSRMPVVMKRIAQGGVRLAMILNRVLGADTDEGFTSPT